MSTPLEVREGFHAAVVEASGLHAAAVLWGSSEGAVGDPLIVLSTVSSVEVTPWRETLVAVPATGDLARSLSQTRDLTFQVKVETINGEVADDAFDLAQATALGLWKLSATGVLEGSLIDFHPTIRPHIPFRFDGRLVHAFTFDATVRAQFTSTDPTAVGVIEHVISSGETSDPTVIIPTEVDKP